MTLSVFIVGSTQRPYNIAFVGDVGTNYIQGLPSWVSVACFHYIKRMSSILTFDL